MLRRLSFAVALGVAVLVDSRIFAQAPAVETPSVVAFDQLQSLQQRLDRLEKQNRDLQETVRNIKPSPSTAPVVLPPMTVDSPAATANASPPANAPSPTETADEGAVVGSFLNAKATWTTNPGATGHQLWFETEDKAFRFHVGAQLQPDWTFDAGATRGVEEGAGGTGPFLEGFNFRRARINLDGWMYENVDYCFEFDFCNTPFITGVRPGNTTLAGTPTNTHPFGNVDNFVAPTNVWASINSLPFVGGIRAGSLKPAIGLEHLTSARFLDFLERSGLFDAYYNRNNGYAPGFMIFNNTEDKLATYQVTATRTANTGFGFNQGGGAWEYCGRLTWLPWYEDEGRCMIHLGLGGKYQTNDRSTGIGVLNLNERWQLRNSQAGLQNTVALAFLTANAQAMINPEFFMNLGPLSMQAEYYGSHAIGATSFQSQATTAPFRFPSRSFNTQGYYVQAMYFLTGEHRPYGQTAVHGSGAAPTRVVPFSNYYWLRGASGNIFSAGAWQVGARYTYSSLEDNGLSGGVINEVTLGLNWFLNPNLKFQWNYDIGHRELAGGNSNGDFYGFGMRMALDF